MNSSEIIAKIEAAITAAVRSPEKILSSGFVELARDEDDNEIADVIRVDLCKWKTTSGDREARVDYEREFDYVSGKILDLARPFAESIEQTGTGSGDGELIECWTITLKK